MAKNNSINNKSGLLEIDPGVSGDSFIQFTINTTDKFRIGVDDDDSDSFKISSGSALGTTDAFVMSASGERTMPLQPAVSAYLGTSDSNVTGDGTTYTFGSGNALTEIFDQNNDFATSGTFTAPVTGRYLIILSFRILPSLTSSHTSLVSNIVTSNRTYLCNYINPYAKASSSGYLSINNAVLADMDSSDTATFTLAISGGSKVVDIQGAASFCSFVNIYLVC